MDTLELLGHPLRLRIVHALSGGRILTIAEIGARIPDAPKTSVYRHVGLLADGGVLEVAGEQRVRGAVERRYRLRQERAVIGADLAATLSLEDYRRGFGVAMAALIAEFNAYLDRDHADPVADLVGFRQHAIWLSPDELDQLIADLRTAIVRQLTNPPSPERTRHLLSPIMFPLEARPEPGKAPRPGKAKASD